MNRDLLANAIQDMIIFLRYLPYSLIFYSLLLLLAYHEHPSYLYFVALLLVMYVLIGLSLLIRIQFRLYKVMSQ